MSYPLISIIMPSYNQVAYIDEAIRSVIEQDYPHKELIIIDGGSSDGATAVIQAHASSIAYWESEKDRGQSHAINKGFARASGQLLTWLNSDDVLIPGTLTEVAKAYRQSSRSTGRWISGNCVWMNPEGRVMRCIHGTGVGTSLIRRGAMTISGPTSFFSPDLLQTTGDLDEDFHYMMDTELWIRFAKLTHLQHVSRYFWGLRLHPAAKMSGHNFADSPMASAEHPVWTKRRNERLKIEERHGIQKGSLRVAKIMTRLVRLGSLATVRALLETRRYAGVHWRELYPCQEGAARDA